MKQRPFTRRCHRGEYGFVADTEFHHRLDVIAGFGPAPLRRISSVRVLTSYGMTENTASVVLDPKTVP